MLKKFLTVALPLLLPFIVYGIYLALARRKARLAGTGQLPRWQEAPWTWIVISSVLLMAAVLVALRMMSGVEPGTKLEPPRFIDGEVQPGRAVD